MLTRYLSEALVKFNRVCLMQPIKMRCARSPKPPSAKTLFKLTANTMSALKTVSLFSSTNSKNELEKKRLKVFDFDNPENNHFLCVRELWVRGDIYRRRADIVGFVNGLPLMFVECKTIHKDIRHAFEQNLSDYKDTIPHLFHHNAFVILGNGVDAKIGSISSKFGHFNDWKRLAEDDVVVDMETLLKGICIKRDFLNLFENYTLL
ncbi:MAG: type I restriction endonuclease [Halioglobus sp.]